MGNIRLSTIIFGFVFLARILMIGPWIEIPFFTPFQLSVYGELMGERYEFPLDEVFSAILAQEVRGYRWILWFGEVVIDGLTLMGMIGLCLKRQWLSQSFWRAWVFVSGGWQIFASGWLAGDMAALLVWLLISMGAPYLLWLYGWKRQWLQERME